MLNAMGVTLLALNHDDSRARARGNCLYASWTIGIT